MGESLSGKEFGKNWIFKMDARGQFWWKTDNFACWSSLWSQIRSIQLFSHWVRIFLSMRTCRMEEDRPPRRLCPLICQCKNYTFAFSSPWCLLNKSYCFDIEWSEHVAKYDNMPHGWSLAEIGNSKWRWLF